MRDIPATRDYIVFDIGDDSIFVARQRDGSVKAYLNARLHRGNQLCVGRGHAKAFRCPFHGFTWGIEGKLRWIPGEWDFPHLDGDGLANRYKAAHVSGRSAVRARCFDPPGFAEHGKGAGLAIVDVA